MAALRGKIKREEVDIMARLIVEAFGEDGPAAPGNRRQAYIIVSVTDTEGVPVTGLEAPNFQIDARLVAPGGAQVTLTDVVRSQLNGFYALYLVPVQQYTWLGGGPYVFTIAVRRGTDRGQTLANVLVEE